MPGYVIHLAVAEEYLRNHREVEEDYNDFIEGVIYPDSVKDKSLTHYGKGSAESNLYEFLKENSLDNSFKKGYFLHLLTDYLFYNQYIDTFSKEIYNDYDLLNKGLIEDYKVTVPEKVADQAFFKEGSEPKILKRAVVDELIKNISTMNIDDIVKDIKENPEKWTKIRPLKHI